MYSVNLDWCYFCVFSSARLTFSPAWFSCICSCYWHELTHSAAIDSCTDDYIPLAQMCTFFVITSFVCNTIESLRRVFSAWLLHQWGLLFLSAWGPLDGLGLVVVEQRDCPCLDTAHTNIRCPSPLALSSQGSPDVQKLTLEEQDAFLLNFPLPPPVKFTWNSSELRTSWKLELEMLSQTPVLTLLMEI